MNMNKNIAYINNTRNHQVKNGFVGLPQELLAVHKGQYQALAPQLLPAAMADRQAHGYALPGYMTWTAVQPMFVSSANVIQSTIFQSGQGGYPAFFPPVIPTCLQQSQSRFGSLPVYVSGSVSHPSQTHTHPSLTRKLSEQPRDHFFQPGKQRITDASSQDGCRVNPPQRVNSSSKNHELMNSNARNILEVKMVQNPIYGENEENGEEISKKLSSSKQKHRNEWRYDSDRWDTVSALCHALEQMCRVNNNREKAKRLKTRFHATTVPSITLADYLKRITWFFECPKECFVLALEYIHRLVRCKPEMEVNYRTVHRLVLTCIKISAKFFDDTRFNSTFYAQVTGVPMFTINAFEVELLFFLSFDLYVQPEQYEARYKAMMIDNQGPSKVTILPGSTSQN